jgi:hypothetical protein
VFAAFTAMHVLPPVRLGTRFETSLSFKSAIHHSALMYPASAIIDSARNVHT